METVKCVGIKTRSGSFRILHWHYFDHNCRYTMKDQNTAKQFDAAFKRDLEDPRQSWPLGTPEFAECELVMFNTSLSNARGFWYMEKSMISNLRFQKDKR